MNKVFFGDCRQTMRQLVEQGVKVQCCVTSPPYFGLRSYMPDAVRLRDNLTSEEREHIEREIKKLGICPIRDGV